MLSKVLTILSHQPETFLPLEHVGLKASLSLEDLDALWDQLQTVPEIETLTLGDGAVRLCRLLPTAHVAVVDALYRPLAPTKMTTAAGLVAREKAAWQVTPLGRPQLVLAKPAWGLLWLHVFYNAANRVMRLHALTCAFVQTVSEVASLRYLPPSLSSKSNLNVTLVADSPSGLAALLELLRVRLRAEEVLPCQHCRTWLPIPWPIRDLEKCDAGFELLLQKAKQLNSLADAVMHVMREMSPEDRVPYHQLVAWCHTLMDKRPKDFIFGEPVNWDASDVEAAIEEMLRAHGGFVAWPVLVRRMRKRFPYISEQMIKKCLNRVKQQRGTTLFRRTRSNQAAVQPENQH